MEAERADGGCGSFLFHSIRGRRDQFPKRRHHQGAISRLEAEQRLRWQDTGVFLVRESESAPGEFSLSVRVEHFRVLEGGGQYYIWDKAFCSLNRLVEFYRVHSIAVEKVVRLRDFPSSPHLHSHPGRIPYPNPYKSSSLESIPSAQLRSNPSPRERQTSAHSLKPVLEV
ncbi:hypothetical protein GOODEAATRI_007146 [Goodea atripinnis]|uniref:SH2 domain-containing protein n=1 Tax=Goodea atripinnis TaxID=208336 RepID=A0ABV0PC98_9TELE